MPLASPRPTPTRLRKSRGRSDRPHPHDAWATSHLTCTQWGTVGRDPQRQPCSPICATAVAWDCVQVDVAAPSIGLLLKCLRTVILIDLILCAHHRKRGCPSPRREPAEAQRRRTRTRGPGAALRAHATALHTRPLLSHSSAIDTCCFCPLCVRGVTPRDSGGAVTLTGAVMTGAQKLRAPNGQRKIERHLWTHPRLFQNLTCLSVAAVAFSMHAEPIRLPVNRREEMRASLLLLCLWAVSSAALSSAQSCGTNGQCKTASTCASWSTQDATTGQCGSGLTCCQEPSCQSGSTVGVCQDYTTCNTGNIATGLCPGDSTIRCCLPAAAPPSCQGSSGAFGTCIATTSCTTGNIESNLCPGDSTIKW